MTTIAFLLDGRIRARSTAESDDPYGPEIQRKATRVIQLIRDTGITGRFALTAACGNITTILWQSRAL